MKKLLLVIISILFFNNIFSQDYQDYIVKLNFDTVPCKIVLVKNLYIKYLTEDSNFQIIKVSILNTDMVGYKQENKDFVTTSYKVLNEGYTSELLFNNKPTVYVSFENAGSELIKYSNHIYIGYGLTGLGTGIILLGATGTRTESTRIIGGIISVIGAVLCIESHSHIAKAGIILKKMDKNTSLYLQDNNGIGLTLKF